MDEIMNWVTLYKKSTTSKIIEWEICVKNKIGSSVIEVKFGQQNGKKQIKSTCLTVGKNIGKKNETSHYEQAILEASSKFNKQLKEGYVKTISEIENDTVDESVEGGIIPMLAHRYQDHTNKIKYPVFIQPKLNGHRCIALKKNGKVELWTRKRKSIKTVPHLIKQLEEMLDDQEDGTFLDGELYKHGWTLQRISSAGKKANPDSTELEFHMYDCGVANTMLKYVGRYNFLNQLIRLHPSEHIKVVNSHQVLEEFQLKMNHDIAVGEGYEGIMIRDLNTLYEHKRSYSLLKMKEMKDAEFVIEDVKKGKDNTVIFVVRASENVQCDVTMSGPRKDNQRFLTDQSLWYGKLLTVQFQSYTPEGSLEFPVGLQIKDDL